nr:Lipase domain containing protein [Haemonchus contortus]
MTTLVSITACLLLIILGIRLAIADFSPSFNKFLISTYGKQIADRMARNDIGAHASFGGGDDIPTRTDRQQSVILVHGLAGSAKTLEAQRRYFLKAGWNESDIYGTTYGDGERTFLYADSMKCEYVKQIRLLIQAVAAFTEQRVDVVGYSMGSPISRKAILGGQCVDTKEELGPPLTELIDTFVSVAGVNYGAQLCFLPIAKLCNPISGLYCTSKYLEDINTKQKYEGLYIYAIYSEQDEIIGYRNTCGNISASLAGADEEFQRPGGHAQIMEGTVDLQANLISRHREHRQ